MKNSIIGAVGVILLVLSAGATGEVVSLPLNCAGTYEIYSTAWSYDFDFGVTFSQITNVYIDWSGEATANLYYLDGRTDPKGSVIGAAIELSYPQYADVTIGGGMSTYPDPEPFNEISEFQLDGGSWANILDGRGIIRIGYSMPIMPGIGYFVEYGSVVLNDSTLIVEGTVVPEPATIFLMSLGLLGIRSISRRTE